MVRAGPVSSVRRKGSSIWKDISVWKGQCLGEDETEKGASVLCGALSAHIENNANYIKALQAPSTSG